MSHNCHIEPVRKTASAEELANQDTALLEIWGMGCVNCAARVRNSLLSTTGIIEAEVDHVTASGRVIFNPDLVTPAALAEAVAQAGNDGRHRYHAEVVAVVE